ncbi:MAG: Uma2 family endonuclease [Leptospirales bacterium]
MTGFSSPSAPNYNSFSNKYVGDTDHVFGNNSSNKINPRYNGMKVSREVYLDLESDGYKYDMVDGLLVLSPSAKYGHGKCQGKTLFLIHNYLKANPVGEVVTEIDIFLPDGGDVLRPDISFILNENLGIVQGHIHGVPDLVCEILSESTEKRDTGVKAERYLVNGVKEYWVLDPRNQTVQVWHNRKTRWKKETKGPFESQVLKGFSLSKENSF